MKKSTFNPPVAYRFGDWGPSYLMADDDFELGVVRVRPGDFLPNHYHEHCHETFIVVEGSCSVWINEEKEVSLNVGDIMSSEPREHHHVRNDGSEDCRFIFIKTPASPGDTINVEWVPPTK